MPEVPIVWRNVDVPIPSDALLSTEYSWVEDADAFTPKLVDVPTEKF